MNRLINWVIGGAVVAVVAGFVIVMAAPARGPVFIASDQPVTEQQIRQKLQRDGWSNVRITREGRYFEAIASKDGQNTKMDVDSQTGRLRPDDDDD